MDRIMQALERAREDGITAAPGPRHGDSPPPVRPVPPPGRTGSHSDGAGSGPIVYSRTRTVPVSRAALRRRRAVAPGDTGPAVDAYRVLSTQVLQRLRENDWNAVAMVSAGFHEGKTLTAVNLAICLSMEVGHTVLLVDADLRNPGVHRYFEVPATPGLSDHLLDGAALDDILFHPAIEGLVVLPAGRALATSSELLGSARMAALVQEMKRRYPARIVLFDLPPVLSAADALAFAPHVDAAILVVQEGRTAADEVLRVAELLDSTHLIGTVLNDSRHAEIRHDETAAPVESGVTRSAADSPAHRPARAAGGWWSRLFRSLRRGT